MTKIAAGLDAFQRAGGKSVKQGEWFHHQALAFTAPNIETRVSKALPDGTIIRAVYYFAAPNLVADPCNVRISITLVSDEGATAVEIQFAEPIIQIIAGAATRAITIRGAQQDLFYPVRRVIRGSNKRIGIMFESLNATNDSVRAGVWYQEP